MKKFGNFIISALKKLWFLIKTRTTLVLGFAFVYVIPILMLNEKIALTKTISGGVKLTYMGIISAVVLFFIFKKKISEAVHRIKNKVVVAILSGVYRTSLMGILYIVFGAMVSLLGLLKEWSALSIISVAIGSVFYIIDKVIQKRINPKEVEDEN